MIKRIEPRELTTHPLRCSHSTKDVTLFTNRDTCNAKDPHTVPTCSLQWSGTLLKGHCSPLNPLLVRDSTL